MQAQLMVRPSNFLAMGMVLEPFGNVSLFRFSDTLHERRGLLLNKLKDDALTPEEAAEYEGICDLDRIFTRINAELAAQAKWCPITLDS